ncbi:MAG: heparan-alpha-glucosaminide N-acetyltransferase domain-containing protein [Bacteroidota bacterium]
MNDAVPRTRRIEFIDLLRGWAVIVMIETHVFNATLTREIRGTDLFEFLAFVNGLVAPSFLFASGMAWAVTTRRKLNDYLSFGKPLVKQFGRLLFVLGIGYLLHMPKFNYDQLINLTEEEPWRLFFQADVLQCIAVSLMFMQCLLLVVKNEHRLYLILFGLTVAIVFLAPVMWGIDFWPLLPAVIAGYMNGNHFSGFPGFPIFPWSAFLFAGAIAGYYYLESRPHEETAQKFMKRLLLWVPALIGVSFLIHPMAESVYPTYDYWRFSPSFCLVRLGIVMILCGVMYFYEKRKGLSPSSPVTLMGRESLIVYTTHLLLIYGDFGKFNFQKYVNNSFGYGGAIVVTLVLLGLMYGVAYAWTRIKRESPRWKMILQYGTLAFLVGVFFFGPGE